MHVEHVSPDATLEEVLEIMERDGCVVIDNLIDADTVAAIRSEMDPYVNAAPKGVDDFAGFNTRRAGSLVARSKTSHDVIMNPKVLEVCGQALSHASNFQLHVTEAVAIGPDSTAQMIHRDQWAFDMFPFPAGYETTFATMWALTDFTEANGATRIIPGSHKKGDGLQFSLEDSIPAEMTAGSVLFYMGSTYHGGGPNSTTDSTRLGLIVQYTLGWLRQEENQYLGVPQEVLDGMSEQMLRLIGYTKGAYSLGFYDGGRDPIAAVRPDLERENVPENFDEEAAKAALEAQRAASES